MNANPKAVYKLKKSEWKLIDSLYRKYRRAVQIDDTENSSESYTARTQSHTKWLNSLSAAEARIDDGHFELGINIVLDYKRRPAQTLSASIYNKIEARQLAAHNPVSFMDFFEPGPNIACCVSDVRYDQRLRELPFYGYSLSQAIQAYADGTVKMSAQIIDMIRHNGFVSGNKPARKLPV